MHFEMKPLWVSWTLSPQSIWSSDKLITNDRMTFDGRSSQIWIFLTLPLVLLLFSRPDGNPICQCGSCCHQICQHRAVLSYVQERHALWIGAYTTWQHFSGGQDFWTGKESCWGCMIYMSPKWMGCSCLMFPKRGKIWEIFWWKVQRDVRLL